MCPALPNARHTLINPIAGDALRERKDIDGTVIPDGFDFDREVLPIDEPSLPRAASTSSAGDDRPVAADDLVVAMPARVAINKSIELAIQLVAALGARRAALQAPPTASATGAGASPPPAASSCCCRRARTSTTTATTSTGSSPTRGTWGSPSPTAATSSSPTGATPRRHRALPVLQHLPGGGPGLLPARARGLRQPGHRSGVGAAAAGGVRVPGVRALRARAHPALHLPRRRRPARAARRLRWPPPAARRRPRHAPSTRPSRCSSTTTPNGAGQRRTSGRCARSAASTSSPTSTSRLYGELGDGDSRRGVLGPARSASRSMSSPSRQVPSGARQ